MDENPYRSPEFVNDPVGTDLSAKVQRVEFRQRWLAVSGAAQLVMILVAAADLPRFDSFGLLLLPVLLLAALCSAVLIYLLALDVFSPAWSLFLGLLLGGYALVPCLGLIGTFYVFDQASTLLSTSRLKLGLLGEDAELKEKQLADHLRRDPPVPPSPPPANESPTKS